MSNFYSLEGVDVEKIWGHSIGKTHIVNLQFPHFTNTPSELKKSLTGLYARAYNKQHREHQYCMVLYTVDDLADPHYERHFTDAKQITHHLKALQKFTDEYEMKMSFCLGFAIKDDGTVSRNSCANVLSTGTRTMPAKYYEQLFRIVERECRFPVQYQVAHNFKCDKSGVEPILGARYLKIGTTYNLCQEEFEKLNAREKKGFVKIEGPDEHDEDEDEGNNESERFIEMKVSEVYQRLREEGSKITPKLVRHILEKELDAKLDIWRAKIKWKIELIIKEEAEAQKLKEQEEEEDEDGEEEDEDGEEEDEEEEEEEEEEEDEDGEEEDEA